MSLYPNSEKLLRMVLLLRYGKNKIMEASQDVIAIYPGIFDEDMESMINHKQYDKVLEIAQLNFPLIKEGEDERLHYAKLIAESAFYLSKSEEEREALEECFIEEYDVQPAIALLTRFNLSEQDIKPIMKRAERYQSKYGTMSDFMWQKGIETDKYVSLLLGNAKPVLDAIQNNQLYEEDELVLILLVLNLLDELNNQTVIDQLYKKLRNYLQDINHFDIRDCISNWKKFHPSNKLEKQYIFDELLPYVDRQARKILDARMTYRYEHAALLLASIAEAGVTLGKFYMPMEFLNIYLKEYSRLRSFKKQVKDLGY